MRFRRRKGRVLAIKLGLNPNSSSLGVDVTFLLAGAALFSFATPVLSALVRWRASSPSGDSLTGPGASPDDTADDINDDNARHDSTESRTA